MLASHDASSSQVLKWSSSELPNCFLVGLMVISKLHGRIEISWRLDVGVVHHWNHTDQNCLNSKDWSPSFFRGFLGVHGVNTWGVKDRNAHFSVGVNIWMPHFGFESHCWRVVGIVVRKLQLGFEVSSLIQRVFWTLEDDVPKEKIIVIFETDGSM